MTPNVPRGRFGVAALAVVAAGCGETPGSSLDRPFGDAPATTRLHLLAPGARIWGGEQRLLASDAAEFDQLGYSVSLAEDRALVGAYGADLYRGSAYVFARSEAAFGEEQALGASDGVEDDYFGWAVSLGDGRALIGAYAADAYRGAAYVFVRSGDSWTEEQKLVASDGAAGRQFGHSVSLAGDRALIGEVGDGATPGAAYVFVRSGSSWTEERKLVASDGAETDRFGHSVALGGERALVGSPSNDTARGAAYAFVRSGSSWTEEQKLVASDAAEDDHFGVSVALTDERAMVGAYWDDTLRGAVYGFVRSGSTWTEEQKLVASDGAEGHRFGNSVSLDDDRVLVGAYGRGAAYVFARDGNAWTEEQRFVAGTEATGNLFGWSVSLSDDRALVGAHYDDNLRGAAYAYSFGLANGELCADDTECANGHCVDEVCCDLGCDEACEACTTELKGSGDDGECGPIEPQADTEDECPDDGASLGTRCTSGEECASGHCVDRVCCDTSCDDTCEGCTAALKGEGEDGTCGHVVAGLNAPISSSDPTLDCEESATCLGPTCDGEGGCDCAPGCATAEDCSPGKTCDPNGVCVSAPKGGDPDDDSGCGCRTIGSSRFAPSSWLGVPLALLLFSRRLRARRSERAKVRRASLSSAPHFSR